MIRNLCIAALVRVDRCLGWAMDHEPWALLIVGCCGAALAWLFLWWLG